jgi:hypothetical protein
VDDFSKFKQLYGASDSPSHYTKRVYRLVETQEIAATTKLVDDLDEQFILEQMLDEVKPSYRAGSEHLHYLLKTPFRYPPLKYGSRFGSRSMESFFYAGEDEKSTLAEVAYYRFVFMSHMQESYHKAVCSEHLLFSVTLDSELCLDLSKACFSSFKELVTSPNNYGFCQRLGQWLSEQEELEMLRYPSARLAQGFNVALSSPSALSSTEPEKSQSWLCHSQNHKVSFTRLGGQHPISFLLSDFLIDGELPLPP